MTCAVCFIYRFGHMETPGVIFVVFLGNGLDPNTTPGPSCRLSACVKLGSFSVY